MCCRSNTRLLPWFMIFSLKLQALFGDKGRLIGQVSLRIIMNTKIHVILEFLIDSYGMDKTILKD